MNLLKDLTAYDGDTNGSKETTLRVLIEVPKGSIHKYEYDTRGFFTIVRELSPKYSYIYNYGCIPQTLGGDGDNLDAIVLSTEPIASGTIVNCKVLAAVKTIDKGEIDDKIICVPYYVKTGKVNIKRIINYLNHYKYPHQQGTEVLDVILAKEAYKLINEAILRYTKEKINGSNIKTEINIKSDFKNYS